MISARTAESPTENPIFWRGINFSGFASQRSSALSFHTTVEFLTLLAARGIGAVRRGENRLRGGEKEDRAGVLQDALYAPNGMPPAGSGRPSHVRNRAHADIRRRGSRGSRAEGKAKSRIRRGSGCVGESS